MHNCVLSKWKIKIENNEQLSEQIINVKHQRYMKELNAWN